jgi:hypothetical protein
VRLGGNSQNYCRRSSAISIVNRQNETLLTVSEDVSKGVKKVLAVCDGAVLAICKTGHF